MRGGRGETRRRGEEGKRRKIGWRELRRNGREERAATEGNLLSILGISLICISFLKERTANSGARLGFESSTPHSTSTPVKSEKQEVEN